AAIISIAQHASPNCNWYSDDRRAQFSRLSSDVITILLLSNCLSRSPIVFSLRCCVFVHIRCLVRDNANSLDIPRYSRNRLIPVQISLYPNVCISDNQDREKNNHLNECEHAKLLKDESPREKKYHFDVEDKKDERYNIKTDIEFYP